MLRLLSSSCSDAGTTTERVREWPETASTLFVGVSVWLVPDSVRFSDDVSLIKSNEFHQLLDNLVYFSLTFGKQVITVLQRCPSPAQDLFRVSCYHLCASWSLSEVDRPLDRIRSWEKGTSQQLFGELSAGPRWWFTCPGSSKSFPWTYLSAFPVLLNYLPPPMPHLPPERPFAFSLRLSSCE